MANKPNSLCWYCKRTVDEMLPCPWIDDGVPVSGWTVTDTHKISGANIRKGPAMTCMVHECPLFYRHTNSITFSEYLNEISTEINYPYARAHSYPEKLIKKYTDLTGKTHPEWVMYELQIELKKKEAKKLEKLNKLLDK